jgi:hypothetical protein
MWGVGSGSQNNGSSGQYQMGGGGGDAGGGQKKQMWAVGSSHSISAADYEASQRNASGNGGGADDLTTAFNSGWNKISEFASGVKQSDTTEKMMLQAQVGLVKGKEMGSKGWNSLLSFTKSAVSTIKDNISDITSDHQGGQQQRTYDTSYNSYQSTSNNNNGNNGSDFFGGFDSNNGGNSSSMVQQSGQSYTEGFGSKQGLKVSTMKKSSSFSADQRSPRSPRSPRKSMGARKAKVEDDNWGKW